MGYLRRNNKHLTGHKLATSAKRKELELQAQFWLAYSFVACRSRLNVRYLIGPERGARALGFHRHAAQYLSHVVFGLSTSFICSQTRRHRSSVIDAFRLIEDERDDVAVDKALIFAEVALSAMQHSVARDSR